MTKDQRFRENFYLQDKHYPMRFLSPNFNIKWTELILQKMLRN